MQPSGDDSGRHAVTRLRFVGAGQLVEHLARHAGNKVGHGDDAGEFPILVEDQKPPYLLFAHALECIGSGAILRAGHRISRQYVAHGRAVAIKAFGHAAGHNIAVGQQPPRGVRRHRYR